MVVTFRTQLSQTPQLTLPRTSRVDGQSQLCAWAIVARSLRKIVTRSLLGTESGMEAIVTRIGVLPSTAVASTRKATPCLCNLCSTSLTTEWQAGSVAVGYAHKAGAASRAAAVATADGDADDDVVVVGVTLAGNRDVFDPALNKARSAGKPEEDKVRDAGKGL